MSKISLGAKFWVKMFTPCMRYVWKYLFRVLWLYHSFIAVAANVDEEPAEGKGQLDEGSEQVKETGEEEMDSEKENAATEGGLTAQGDADSADNVSERAGNQQGVGEGGDGIETEGKGQTSAGEQQTGAEAPSEDVGGASKEEAAPVYTKFLALDKPLPRKRFLQVCVARWNECS